jgi:hypothetical protein
MKPIKTGDVVTLQPISEYAKDREGDKWVVEAIAEKMLFDDKIGVWVGLKAKSGYDLGFRWVHLTNDEHFKIIQ